MIECHSVKSWFQEVRQRYPLHLTQLNDSTEAFTILFNPRPRQTLLVARFDRTRSYGVVICRRNVDIPVNYEKRQNK